ncbi:MAG TPA: cyanophycin synthetase, partial [Bacillota bacterium]|nr:cyanophycin synthetase [Bacillota bacterium]
VINGDDAVLVSLVKRFRSKIIYFTRTWDNPVVRRHLGCGGSAVLEKAGQIILARGQEATFLMDIRNIPATYGGLAGHNVENSLAAIAAAVGLGVETADIVRGLQGFSSNLKLNPGRMNILTLGDIRLVLDYGHNPMGFSRVIQSLKKLHHGQLTGVVGMPGDRRDKDIREAGRILARGLDRMIIKEDGDLRGRRPGEVADLLKHSALESGFDPARVTVLPDEAQAAQYALETARPGEMIVVFYEKLAKVLPAIERAVNRDFSPEDRQDFLRHCQNIIS